ncbi:MAG: VWA domain-containing protein [Planctomycetes bacterium]|nr:VWA domain-containing protein [Planctomycetota bacterium]
MMDWSISPVFGSFWIVVVAGLGLLMILLLLQESGRLTRWQWIALWTLRCLMCLVLFLFLLRPGVTFTKQNAPSGSVAILVDESTSMLLPSGDTSQTRWEQQLQAVSKIWDRREELGPNNQWSLFSYSTSLRPISSSKAGEKSEPALPLQPTGASTDIGGPLGQLLGESLESPLSAVIWLGDGSQTLVPATGDALQFTRRLTQLDVPLYVVGIGPRADSDNSRDLSVESVAEQLDVFTKNQLNVLGALRCRGVANQELVIKLMLQKAGEPSREVSRAKIRPGRSDETIPFQLPLIAPDPGAYELLVRAEPVEREATTQNNEALVYLNVRSGGARILYLEGEPTFEMKFLRRAIAESQDLDMFVRAIWKPPVQKWPVDLSEQLSGNVYDCIILGDLDYAAVEAAGAAKIAEQVRNGAGLITLGGFHTYGPGGWSQSSEFSGILPIQLSATNRSTIDGKIDLRDHIGGPVRVVPVGMPDVLQIDSPEKSSDAWRQLNPLLGATRWAGVKNTPGTVLLAQSEKNEPLIASGFADKGRVVSIAFDSTYIWARQGKIAEHKAFWRKLIYWCMRREKIEEGLQMRMSQRRLSLEQSSEMILEWIPGSAGAEMPSNISLQLWKLGEPGENSNESDLGSVPLVKRDNASMRADFKGVKQGGRFEWRAQTTGSAGQILESRLPFIVIDKSVENTQPIPDWQLMEQMAKLNASAGGVLIAPDQTDDILKQLQDRRKQSTETIIENRKLGEGLFDSWIAFLALGCLMVMQWSLRKRWNLP